MEVESKTGSKHTRTPCCRSTKDTGKCLTMPHYCLSAEISGLQVRVLPGSPLLTNVYAGFCNMWKVPRASNPLGSIEVPLLAGLGGFRLFIINGRPRDCRCAVAPFPSHPKVASGRRCCTCQTLSGSCDANAHGNPFQSMRERRLAVIFR
jgi:hypothetical protein